MLLQPTVLHLKIQLTIHGGTDHLIHPLKLNRVRIQKKHSLENFYMQSSGTVKMKRMLN